MSVEACGRCAGHGTIQGIRFDMESSPIQSYKEPCPQCSWQLDGTSKGVVSCFYGCGFSVVDINPFHAHKHLEDHFEVAHREELEKLHEPGEPVSEEEK